MYKNNMKTNYPAGYTIPIRSLRRPPYWLEQPPRVVRIRENLDLFIGYYTRRKNPTSSLRQALHELGKLARID